MTEKLRAKGLDAFVQEAAKASKEGKKLGKPTVVGANLITKATTNVELITDNDEKNPRVTVSGLHKKIDKLTEQGVKIVGTRIVGALGSPLLNATFIAPVIDIVADKVGDIVADGVELAVDAVDEFFDGDKDEETKESTKPVKGRSNAAQANKKTKPKTTTRTKKAVPKKEEETKPTE